MQDVINYVLIALEFIISGQLFALLNGNFWEKDLNYNKICKICQVAAVIFWEVTQMDQSMIWMAQFLLRG